MTPSRIKDVIQWLEDQSGDFSKMHNEIMFLRDAAELAKKYLAFTKIFDYVIEAINSKEKSPD